ncbi:NADH-quinone oxidoreductase subunit N [Candidatus Portiera aleyrodidarum]|uniref:NADH-quinone oxidoreductase subunit N n=2 Tax=Candidatus Portiera aleyrodidarum TaxID=91844 RepID=A0AAU8RQM3_9GAMM|nr:NADH-quinone oxidoreductase subunit N [Candidatus Portiera aleyrodidarum]AFQ23977.1 NADH:ubiquinone oxidoreductase subunit 2 (chain N) [Candidatus Portiera aleyrodidarum BT-B-HRs]AFS18742.1 NADH-ubiquinone oxidoreductase chain N [Candidatus Portiera aleyrodidarum BT-QVLC]AFT80369.1 ADH-ubiquinone oxidoreductase chain N [Candidatus Portiera aleyrodidarum BT-QVLC]AFT80649.1 ADH-ubiquinone oxidoreductase chain N [Candidatus Portiera aleyrodidarum BT-B-HRs]AJF23956.1 NADH:ubiquinone oxidoreduct
MIKNAQILPISFLFITLIILIITISFNRKNLIIFIITIIGLLISLLSIFLIKHTLFYPLIMIDNYSLFYTFLILISALYCSIFSYTYLNKNEEVYMLIICSTIGAILLVLSIHMTTFFIGLELMSIALYGLIIYLRNDKDNDLKALESGIKYMVLSSMASCFLLFGMALLYFYYGNLTFTNYYFKLDDNTTLWTIIGIVLILISLGFKLSIIPFHSYTPDLYEGTMPPITAFIATVTKISVFVAFMRLLMILPNITSFLNNVLTIISIVTILFGNILALKQNNLKRILGYSSIANLGYLLTVIIAMQMHICKFILETINIYLLTYTLTTLGIFGIISLINNETLSFYKGLFWSKPDLAIVLTIMLLSLAGIPLTAGFIGKVYIFLNALNYQLWFILISIGIGNSIGIYYYFRIISFLYMNVNKKQLIFDLNSFVYYLVLSLSLFILVFGLFPQNIISLIRVFS